ncbi:MAG: NADH-quinone oxidoreductase subunit N [Euryarchaeota archaeon]|nr:NADH-quinone oxidoreductase subunit N [Euryarchaeota archaeon]
MTSEAALAPELLLLVFAVALPVVGLFVENKRLLAWMTALALLIAGWWTFGTLFPSGLTSWIPEATLAGPLLFGVYEITPFAQVMKLIFIAVAFLMVLGSPAYLQRLSGTTASSRNVGRGNEGEYYGLIIFSTVGMMVIASGRELLTIFLGLELASFATYVLATYHKKDARSPERSVEPLVDPSRGDAGHAMEAHRGPSATASPGEASASAEAGMKYFIVGALSSALILYGISMIYAITGTTDIAAISRLLTGAPAFNPLLVLSTILLLAGFGYKVAMFPYHLWAPDVYEGSPTPVSGLLAAGTKKAGFAALFKILFIALIGVKANWDVAIAIFAILTMTVGNLVALSQTDIKRMLAYSSIAQAGYILIAFAVGTVYGVTGGIFQILTHALITMGAFIVVAGLAVSGFSGRIEDFRGLGKRAPLIAFAMALFLISLAGLPPLAGFASKFVLFSSAVSVAGLPGKEWLLWLAIAGILNSALSLFYYARVVRYMYVEETIATGPIAMPRGVTAAVVLAMIAVVVIGVYPNPIIELSTRAAQSLLVLAP